VHRSGAVGHNASAEKRIPPPPHYRNNTTVRKKYIKTRFIFHFHYFVVTQIKAVEGKENTPSYIIKRTLKNILKRFGVVNYCRRRKMYA